MDEQITDYFKNPLVKRIIQDYAKAKSRALRHSIYGAIIGTSLIAGSLFHLGIKVHEFANKSMDGGFVEEYAEPNPFIDNLLNQIGFDWKDAQDYLAYASKERELKNISIKDSTTAGGGLALIIVSAFLGSWRIKRNDKKMIKELNFLKKYSSNQRKLLKSNLYYFFQVKCSISQRLKIM